MNLSLTQSVNLFWFDTRKKQREVFETKDTVSTVARSDRCNSVDFCGTRPIFRFSESWWLLAYFGIKNKKNNSRAARQTQSKSVRKIAPHSRTVWLVSDSELPQQTTTFRYSPSLVRHVVIHLDLPPSRCVPMRDDPSLHE